LDHATGLSTLPCTITVHFCDDHSQSASDRPGAAPSALKFVLGCCRDGLPRPYANTNPGLSSIACVCLSSL